MSSGNLEWWEEKYAEYLDEGVYPKGIDVAGIPYDASRILREVDPTAFRCNALDYAEGWGWDTDRDEDDQEEPGE